MKPLSRIATLAILVLSASAFAQAPSSDSTSSPDSSQADWFHRRPSQLARR